MLGASLNLQHLRYFHAVAHAGSLTAAAERLHLSQSALSVQIRKLEDRLGHALFERRGRALHLTEAGRIALAHADAIFATSAELVATLQRTGEGHPPLRVGALSTLSRNFQLSFLEPLLGHPEAGLVLRSGSFTELLGALEALTLDVVLSNRPPPADSARAFRCHRLAEQPVSLIATPQRLGDDARDLTSLLRRHPVILPAPGSSVRSGFDALADRLGIQPRPAAEVDDMAMMRLLGRADVGLAILPPIVVRDELAQGLLVEVEQLPDIAETFYAVAMRRRFPNPLLSLLLGASGGLRA